MYKRSAVMLVFPHLQRPMHMQGVEHLKILMSERSHVAPSKANRHFWQLHKELEGKSVPH